MLERATDAHQGRAAALPAILQRALSAARGVVRASPRMTMTSYLFISHKKQISV